MKHLLFTLIAIMGWQVAHAQYDSYDCFDTTTFRKFRSQITGDIMAVADGFKSYRLANEEDMKWNESIQQGQRVYTDDWSLIPQYSAGKYTLHFTQNKEEMEGLRLDKGDDMQEYCIRNQGFYSKKCEVYLKMMVDSTPITLKGFGRGFLGKEPMFPEIDFVIRTDDMKKLANAKTVAMRLVFEEDQVVADDQYAVYFTSDEMCGFKHFSKGQGLHRR